MEGLRGVGPVTASRLSDAGYDTFESLVLASPRTWRVYECRRELDDDAFGKLVEVFATCTRVSRGRGRFRMPTTQARFELLHAAQSPRLVDARFFGRRSLSDKLDGKLEGQQVWRLRGRVAARGAKSWRLQAADVAPIDAAAAAEPHDGLRFEPRYSRVAGVPDSLLRSAIHQALERTTWPETESDERLSDLGMMVLGAALRELHLPSHDPDALERARRRLALREARALLAEVRRRRKRRGRMQAHVLPSEGRVLERVLARLPFEPSPEQMHCLTEIRQDLARPVPMARLLQGDVGSGKTLVAMAAALIAGAAQRQSVILAPTAILADQHARRFAAQLAGARLRVVPFTQSMKKRERDEARAVFASGTPCIAIGTHALLARDIEFGALGLLVVDEQQRFGVRQRGTLFREHAGYVPHVLVMSATPIPRTQATALFGDLDSSELRGRPVERPPVVTTVVDATRWARVRDAIVEEIDRGGRVYVVCPRIGLEDSDSSADSDPESSEPDTAHETYRELRALVKCALVHGRQKREERQRAQRDFVEGRVACLVATTVVEVGVDVPEATWMVVRGAERLGLSSLHQLRGRVGRGALGGRCVLVGDATVERLRVLESCDDGFEIAEADLRARGAGDIAGRLQHGHTRFRCLDPVEDLDLLRIASRDADC